MDINYLLAREQISIVRAMRAANQGARQAHEGLARRYATLLRRIPMPSTRGPGVPQG